MNRKFTLPLLSGALVLLLSASTIVNQGGTYGWTGSPVDGGTGSAGTCLNCHSNSGTAPTMTVSFSPALGSGNTYMPNQTYTVSVAASGSQPKYGFNCEIINSQSTSTSQVGMFGTFGTAVTSNCQIFPLSSTTPYPPCASHNAPSGTGNAATFSFKWTAPTSGTGYLYAIALGANNNGSDVGDHQSAVTSLTLTPSATGIASHEQAVTTLSLFPNPATDQVRLTYSLEERSQVSVKLFNLSGELVSDLLNETQDRGTQNISARLPQNLAKGMYVVKLAVNGRVTSQKLMVN